jgi:hypothetical protein
MKLRKMTQKEAIDFCKSLDFFEYEEEKEFGDITIYIDDEEEEEKGVKNE